MSDVSLLAHGAWQGIGALASIAGVGATFWVARRRKVERTGAVNVVPVGDSVLTTPGAPGVVLTTPGVLPRMAGAALVWLVGWAIYASVWAVLAFALGDDARMVLSLLFVVLGSLPSGLALLIRPPSLGGFVGGSFPLGLLALYFSSMNADMLRTAPAFAYFVVFFLIGGLLGTATAAVAVGAARRVRVPLPRA